jgi:hypothetical protein
MEKAIKERFKGQYPARKPIQTDRGGPLREEFFQWPRLLSEDSGVLPVSNRAPS